jgi:DNA-binding CsgD family transcriptional regulator
MSEPLGQQQCISEDTLQDAFPFIRQGGGKSAPVERRTQALHQTSLHPSSPAGIQRKRFPAELFADLTKREMQDVLEILHYSLEATTGDDVYQVLQLIQRVVACPRVIGGVAQLTSKGSFQEFNSVINVSYSNDWLYTYGRNGYANVDPVLQSVLRTFKTQVWEQTYKHVTSPKQLEFVEEARSYGLTHGITTGMLERRRGFASFFSFAGGDSENTNRYKGLLEYLLPYLHRTLLANTHTPQANRVKGLSPREMLVLEWMKQGKTNWEISRIIGVSERTVRFHVESIFMKLDVGSRTQAVAFAIEHGLFPSV